MEKVVDGVEKSRTRGTPIVTGRVPVAVAVSVAVGRLVGRAAIIGRVSCASNWC
jgi:hypothetical protein